MKASISRGAVYAGNLQGVDGTISTDVNGDGSISLSFNQKMKRTPAVVTTGILEADTIGTLSIIERSQNAIAIQVDGSSVTGGVLSVSAIAYDDTYF